MARLVVEAISNEPTTETKTAGEGGSSTLRLLISVSRADDGTPVTGLKKTHFRVFQPDLAVWTIGGLVVATASIGLLNELPSGQDVVEGSGLYRAQLVLKLASGKQVVFKETEAYSYGIQVIRRNSKTKAMDHGQTVVRAKSRNVVVVPVPGQQM